MVLLSMKMEFGFQRYPDFNRIMGFIPGKVKDDQ
jgi:hypothetical protein